MQIIDLTKTPTREKVTFDNDTVIDKDGIIELLTKLDTLVKLAGAEFRVTVDSNGIYEVGIEKKKITRTRKARPFKSTFDGASILK